MSKRQQLSTFNYSLLFITLFPLQVLLRLRQERRSEDKPSRREKNRTWGQATLQKGRDRGNIKDLDYAHNYENVYGGDDDEDEGIERGRRHSEKGRAPLYRSKSCDRAGVRGAVRDQVISNQESFKQSCLTINPGAKPVRTAEQPRRGNSNLLESLLCHTHPLNPPGFTTIYFSSYFSLPFSFSLEQCST